MASSCVGGQCQLSVSKTGSDATDAYYPILLALTSDILATTYWLINCINPSVLTSFIFFSVFVTCVFSLALSQLGV